MYTTHVYTARLTYFLIQSNQMWQRNSEWGKQPTKPRRRQVNYGRPKPKVSPDEDLSWEVETWIKSFGYVYVNNYYTRCWSSDMHWRWKLTRFLLNLCNEDPSKYHLFYTVFMCVCVCILFFFAITICWIKIYIPVTTINDMRFSKPNNRVRNAAKSSNDYLFFPAGAPLVTSYNLAVPVPCVIRLPANKIVDMRLIFSERGLMFTFAICCRPSVCLSVVCRLSVTLVHPTQADQIFGNISTALGTLATVDIHWKCYGDRSRGTPPPGELNTRGVAKYSDFGPIDGYISETVQDRR